MMSMSNHTNYYSTACSSNYYYSRAYSSNYIWYNPEAIRTQHPLSGLNILRVSVDENGDYQEPTVEDFIEEFVESIPVEELEMYARALQKRLSVETEDGLRILL